MSFSLDALSRWKCSRELVDDYMVSNAGNGPWSCPLYMPRATSSRKKFERGWRQEGTLGNAGKSNFTQLRNLGWSIASRRLTWRDTKAPRPSSSSETAALFERVRRLERVISMLKQERRNARKTWTEIKTPLLLSLNTLSVYAPGHIGLSAGDAHPNYCLGKTKDGKRLDNGDVHTIAGFTKEGDIAPTNGWTIDKKFGHIAHAYTSTSFGANAVKTVDRVLIAMGSQSALALNAEQFYVSRFQRQGIGHDLHRHAACGVEIAD